MTRYREFHFLLVVGQILDGNNRRCFVNRFLFDVIYHKKDDEIVILAVMKLHKEPNYRERKDRSK